MPYFSPEDILKAKEIDLLTYLKNYEPGELVQFSHNIYTTKTHDSLKISNGKWMWWSRGIGGKNALEYLVRVRGYEFWEAVETIVGRTAVRPPIYEKKIKNPDRPLLLPDKAETNDKVIEYLFNRGIDYEIIQYCIEKGFIFESLPYHNVVFVGYDDKDKARYAAYRSTDKKRIMGDCAGSKKEYSFRMGENKLSEVHIFESAIDLLSYATLYKMKGGDFKDLFMVSLAGVYQPKGNLKDSKIPVVITKIIEKNNKLNTVILHLDNDMAGRLATKALQAVMPENIKVIDDPPLRGKDFNDFLCFKLGLNKKIERSLER